MKTILVTGGCGFIGSHLAEKLIRLGYEVLIIDNLSTGRLENIKHFKNKCKFYKADISNIKQIDKYFKDINTVFHCAALADIVPSIQNPKNYYFPFHLKIRYDHQMLYNYQILYLLHYH